ncbi:hypothetical protein PoB_006454500 [Plakobranchus ocellatus]|uniref:Uncharacterized protein n=1 Tax=Plakobranchus ocellatus TaxID=259542 RepID=A0AAV4D202_9GAST|nr:hypothetical protein PoB_006454500 [Plakobranchus ocellatus]
MLQKRHQTASKFLGEYVALRRRNGCVYSIQSINTSPQQGDLRLLGPQSGQGAGSEARTRDRRIPADLREHSLTTVPPTPQKTR